MQKKGSKVISIRVDDSVYGVICDEADGRGMTLTEYVMEALLEKLKVVYTTD